MELARARASATGPKTARMRGPAECGRSRASHRLRKHVTLTRQSRAPLSTFLDAMEPGDDAGPGVFMAGPRVGRRRSVTGLLDPGAGKGDAKPGAPAGGKRPGARARRISITDGQFAEGADASALGSMSGRLQSTTGEMRPAPPPAPRVGMGDALAALTGLVRACKSELVVSRPRERVSVTRGSPWEDVWDDARATRHIQGRVFAPTAHDLRLGRARHSRFYRFYRLRLLLPPPLTAPTPPSRVKPGVTPRVTIYRSAGVAEPPTACGNTLPLTPPPSRRPRRGRGTVRPPAPEEQRRRFRHSRGRGRAPPGEAGGREGAPLW